MEMQIQATLVKDFAVNGSREAIKGSEGMYVCVFKDGRF